MQRTLVVSNRENKVVELEVEINTRGRASFSGIVYEKNLYTSKDIDDMAYELAEEIVRVNSQWFIDNPTSSFNDLIERLDIHEVLNDIENIYYHDNGDVEVWEGVSFGQCIDEMPQSDLVRMWNEYHLKEVSPHEVESIVAMLDSIELNVKQEWGFQSPLKYTDQ